MYCTEFELSSCGKKICCDECNESNCTERCILREPNSCNSRTGIEPIAFMEIEDKRGINDE